MGKFIHGLVSRPVASDIHVFMEEETPVRKKQRSSSVSVDMPLTLKDGKILSTDMPERFQLRSIPVESAEDHELQEEAEWMWRHIFSNPTISKQVLYNISCKN